MSTPSLLVTVEGLLARTYALRARLAPIEDYVIGDRGLALLYAQAGLRTVGSADGSGARLLLRETPGRLRACVYFPDAMIRRLEERPPQRGVDAENVDAFGVFVEEIDHLLVAAERADGGRGISLLELELHAGVSKYLVLARFLAGRTGRLAPSARAWLHHHVFEARDYSDADPEVRGRYVEAGRHAARFVRTLTPLSREARLVRLRRFDRAPLSEKLAMIAAS